MEEQIFISNEEQEKCHKVAKAFAELEQENIVVVDVGKYGFVKLQEYSFPNGFDNVVTFTESSEMFDDLWEEWLDAQLFDLAKGTPMIEMDYADIFKCLPKEKQSELMDKRNYFAQKAGIAL